MNDPSPNNDPQPDRLGGSVILYLVLAAVVCLPIWFVGHFYGADVPPHLHSASLIIDLLGGEAPAGGSYRFNSAPVPNSLGHWMMAGMLLVFSAATTSKLMASGLYCLFVAAVAWLRYAVNGSLGLSLAILFAAVIGLNRLWLVGLYNYLLSAIVVIFTVGLLVRWRGSLSFKRALLLAVCFAAAYFSHLIGFLVLGACAGIYVIAVAGKDRIRSLGLVAAAALPMLPFLFLYRSVSNREGSMVPVWYLLNDPSVNNLLFFLRSADPIFILSRRFIPFLDVESQLTILASPIIWIILAAGILAVSAWIGGRHKNGGRYSLPLLVAAAAVALFAIAAPDELGASEGSVIRPRFFLIAISLGLAILPVPRAGWAKVSAACILTAVFGYQMLGLWEYSLRYDKEVAEFGPIVNVLADGERFASVMVFEEQLRFHPSPIQRIGSLAGIDRDLYAWDTYEAGYYFFPVVAAHAADRQSLVQYSITNIIRPLYAEEDFGTGKQRFAQQLESNRGMIDVLMVRGRNPEIDAIVMQWFGPEPYFETENFRLFRRKQ